MQRHYCILIWLSLLLHVAYGSFKHFLERRGSSEEEDQYSDDILPQPTSTLDDQQDPMVLDYIQRENPVITEIITASLAFFSSLPAMNSIPLDNRIEVLIANDPSKQDLIVQHLQDAYLLLDIRSSELFQAYLDAIASLGTSEQRKIYHDMTVDDLAKRMIFKRPISFSGSVDKTLLRDRSMHQVFVNEWRTFSNKARQGSSNLLRDNSRLTLAEYISYDEMTLSALLGVSSPVFFINSGSRDNMGIYDFSHSFEPSGVYVGLVGPRFENHSEMEARYLVINTPDEEQHYYKHHHHDYINNHFNTFPRRKIIDQIWETFYYPSGFPNYSDLADKLGSAGGNFEGNYFIHLPSNHQYFPNAYVNVSGYKLRLSLVLAPFLSDANHRGHVSMQKVVVHLTGIGLGVWAQVDQILQARWTLEAFAGLVHANAYGSIAKILISWYPPNSHSALQTDDMHSIEQILVDINGWPIKFAFTDAAVAAKLVGEDKGRLVVGCYPWDSNALPGNEYFIGGLKASGDPAAACCSTISQVQNPYINRNLGSAAVQITPFTMN